MRLGNWENPCGDVYTVGKFLSDCRKGFLIDSDGVGYFGDGETFYWEHKAIPGVEDTPKGMTHVLWFNK